MIQASVKINHGLKINYLYYFDEVLICMIPKHLLLNGQRCVNCEKRKDYVRPVYNMYKQLNILAAVKYFANVFILSLILCTHS